MVEPDVTSVIDGLYEAALDPVRWTAVMDGIGRLFGGHTGAILIKMDREHQTSDILSSFDRTSSISEYETNWSQKESTTTRTMAKGQSRPPTTFDILQATWSIPAGQVCSDRMLIDKDALEASDFYNDHLRLFDFYHAFSAKVWSNPCDQGLLSVSRSRRQGEFTCEDLDVYRSIQPHLERALAMAQRLSWTAVGVCERDLAAKTTGCATFILDGAGRCAHLNAAARRLVDGAGVLRMVGDRLKAVSPAVDAQLEGAVLRALGQGRRPGRGSGVAIPRPSNARALATLVAPVITEHDWFLPRRPRAIVTIVDPDVRRTPPVEVLQALYALTPSEALVARGIGQGLDLASIAASHGLTVNTARQYLTRAYAKTQTERQSDLATLVAALAACR